MSAILWRYAFLPRDGCLSALQRGLIHVAQCGDLRAFGPEPLTHMRTPSAPESDNSNVDALIGAQHAGRGCCGPGNGSGLFYEATAILFGHCDLLASAGPDAVDSQLRLAVLVSGFLPEYIASEAAVDSPD
jgi:hypothetical protein